MKDLSVEEEFLKPQMNNHSFDSDNFGDLIKKLNEKDPYTISEQGEPVDFSEILALINLVEKHGDSALHKCLSQLLFRLLEVGILSHPKILSLSEVWDNILGYADTKIRNELTNILQGDPTEDLVSHVFNCLNGDTVRYSRAEVDLNNFIDQLFSKVASTPSGELRCSICGYHFREKDLIIDGSQKRLKKAIRNKVKLTKTLYPGRESDLLKPIEWGNRKLTQLTIDHIVPRETLGWSDDNNLECVCSFCNSGKGAHRWSLEPLSSFAIGALSNFPVNRKISHLKAIIIVSTLRSQQGICCLCGKSKKQIEMTVRTIGNIDQNCYQGFSPWNLQTICYECVFKSNSN